MCGIAGQLKLNGGPVDRDQLGKMIAMLRHRGPDASGIQVSGMAGLAHARLSIIDLQGGAQPMSTSGGRLWITFNGEIFNYIELREELVGKGHRFATRSDTEVILHAYREYGEDCVQHFNGQWAFALWDSEQQKLFLSRDRFGVRPLFYTQTAESFLFASEIKALLTCPEVPAEVDLQGLDQIFTFWVTLPPRTIFKNILQLPPGCSLSVKDGQVRVSQYWSISYAEAGELSGADEDTLAEELLNLLEDATRIRLRSDVPVGAYLSGGIDSTVTTALVKKIAQDRLRSFAITFEDAEFDEKSYQDEASTFLHTQHTSVRCSRSDIARIFPEVIWHTEQPIIRTAPAPMFLLSELVRENGFKVVLTGEGADEVLGGYDIFKEAKIRRFWGRNLESQWRPLLLRRLYPYMESIQRQPRAYLQHFFRVGGEDLANPFFSHLPRWELTAKLKRFFSAEVREVTEKYDGVSEIERGLPSDYESWSYFSQAEYLEAKYLLPGYILSSQGDRMAMAHSVEGRYPFLDHRVVEFASKLPPNVKMKVLDQKHLLKRAVNGLIPESIVRRPKQPYRAPDGACFFGSETIDYVDELLSPEAVRRNGIFDATAVTALVNKFKNGRASGVKDNMAMVGVLSTQLLIPQFVNQHFSHKEQRGPNTCTHQTSSAKSATLS
jgi:asparagine synthase (glutamine-hydrolysing)